MIITIIIHSFILLKEFCSLLREQSRTRPRSTLGPVPKYTTALFSETNPAQKSGTSPPVFSREVLLLILRFSNNWNYDSFEGSKKTSYSPIPLGYYFRFRYILLLRRSTLQWEISSSKPYFPQNTLRMVFPSSPVLREGVTQKKSRIVGNFPYFAQPPPWN